LESLLDSFSFNLGPQKWKRLSIKDHIQKVSEGILDRDGPYRVINNESFSICDTYPDQIIVPQQIDAKIIQMSSKFRTKSRLPTLTYFDKVTGCSIWRSSQPKSGFMGDHCAQDIFLLE
jgi:hypothetical protein